MIIENIDRMRKTGASVIIIAGGASKRMGSDKRTVKLGGKSLAQHTLDLAMQLSDDIVVSCNIQIPEFEEYLVVPDRTPGGGPAEGLISALPHIQYPNAITLSVDMPFITTGLVRRLLDRHQTREVTFFTFKGKMQPFPAIVPAGLHAAVEHAYANKISSLKGLLASVPYRAIPVSPVKEQELFLNVNSENDLKKARQMYHSQA